MSAFPTYDSPAIDALDTLAPELCAGKDPDERSDVYALATLACSLLYAAEEKDTATESARPVLDRALAADPAERPRDAEAFAHAERKGYQTAGKQHSHYNGGYNPSLAPRQSSCNSARNSGPSACRCSS